MTENVKSFSCWDCQYFEPIDPENNTSGYCRRYAPHSLDFFGCNGGGDDNPLTTKGDLYTRDDIGNQRLPVGAPDQIVVADPSEPTGLKWINMPPGTTPLTTKGDLYTRDASGDQRLPVGTADQILVPDASEPTGLKWINQTPGTSPLTTKGDIYTRDASGDQRLAVGTPGQIISADPAGATGQKWIDLPAAASTYLLPFQAARFGEVQGIEIEVTRDGEDPTSGQVKPIASQYTIYNNGGSYPFAAPHNSKIVALQMTGALFRIGDWQTVGPDPYIVVDFYTIIGTGETLIGSINVPLDPLLTHVSGDANRAFQNVFYLLTTPIDIPTNALFGWRVNCSVNNSTERVYYTTNMITDAYTITAEAAAALLLTPFAFNLPPELIEMAKKALAGDPASLGKFAVLTFGDEMWCGEFKKSSNPIPELPEVTP